MTPPTVSGACDAPSPIAKDGQWRTEPPTQPGVYWFQPEGTDGGSANDEWTTDGVVAQRSPTRGELERPLARANPSLIGTREPLDGLVLIFLGHQADPANGTLDDFP